MTVLALFFDDADARAVAVRLRARGFQAAVTRHRFAGEDDDDDQPWAVLTDAPTVMVDLLLEEYDGWLDEPAAGPAAAPAPGPAADPAAGPAADPAPGQPLPLDLPDGPRRVKGHFRDP